MTLADELSLAGVRRGEPVALVLVPGQGFALAWGPSARQVATDQPEQILAELGELDPRWTWWSARQTAAPLVAAGVQLRSCWDLGAVGRLAHGLRRDDPAAVWAAAGGLDEPVALRRTLDLLDLAGEHGEPVRRDGHLSRDWLHGRATETLASAQEWAELTLRTQGAQELLLRSLPDPRPIPRQPPLALLTAYAESAAAVLAVELEQRGLPLDPAEATRLLTSMIGPRPADADEEAVRRAQRDDLVRSAFPGPPVDLRNPAQVRVLLARVGLDLPDTRSWRLEPHAGTTPGVTELLAWRKAERIATTYGWDWLDRQVGADGRLRGAWGSADAAAGRMTAQAGLHNLPADLRGAVLAEPGCLLVRADLGQVEPRVLAAVSGDPALARAAAQDDMYAPVAASLGCDRPTAKVAVLAAMYGQTSGTAGAALRDMDRAYPVAMAYLRAAEEAGRTGCDLRTYGGRLIRLGGGDSGGDSGGAPVSPGHGRYARNAVVQGAAAELFKAWAATVRAELADLGGEIVLCLHDELLLQVPEAAAPAAADLLRGALQRTAGWWAAGSPVRFVAEVATGASWPAAH